MSDERLRVICIVPDGRDPDRRIDSIGVVIEGGGKRKLLPLDEALNCIKTGTLSFFVEIGDRSVDVEIARHEGTEYLRTHGDSWEENNLLKLPHCQRE